MSKFLNTAEAAHMLGRPERTVQRQASQGALPATKLPGRTGSYVFAREDLEALVAERTTAPAQQ